MRRIGFTLVELLVVLAIIGLLMAVLVPVLQRAKRQARAVQCSSNIRQLFVGLLAYESENDRLPPAFDDTPPGAPPGGDIGFFEYDYVGWWWLNYISISHDTSKDKNRRRVVWCPSRRLENQMFKKNVLCGNYGINRSICRSPHDYQNYREEFIGTPLSTTIDIPHPSRTLLIVDCGYSMITWWHAADTPPHPLNPKMIVDTAYIPGLKINGERELWPGQEDDAINGRHPNKTVNVGFADGHVERRKADELLVESAGDSYKNIKPLWQPR